MKAIFFGLLIVLLLAAAPLSAQTNQTIQELKANAEKGEAVAQTKLAFRYFFGDGVEKDMVEAVKWFRKAAEQNNATAQFTLGFCYSKGKGVEMDAVEAVKWYYKAAEQNDPDAQNELGLCYYKGDGVQKDMVEAVKWFRKATEQNNAKAQCNLGICCRDGHGMEKDTVEAMNWFRKAAEQNYPDAQFNLGCCYRDGVGVEKDTVEAVKWFRKAAEQGDEDSQMVLAACYYTGRGVAKDFVEAAKWWRISANQGSARGQYHLGHCYLDGEGVNKDYIQAYKWFNLASAQGDENSKESLSVAEEDMTPEQISEAQRLTREFTPHKQSSSDSSSENPAATGTGFFITDDGYLISNYHVVKDATRVRLLTGAGLIDAKVVQVDAANDLALLKADGKFSPLPISSSRSAQLGGTVATVGFPDIGLQGFAPKLAKGEIASLSGAGDDPRYFQISAPVQPGNSGGALVDGRGNVIGIVSAKLDAGAALAASGALPENVNYAVKSSLLLSFLESVPDVDAKLKAPNTVDRKFEEVVKSAQDAAVLVLVY